MKKILLSFILAICAINPVFADEQPTRPDIPAGSDGGRPNAPAPTPRVSIFSTSTDWEGVTGLQLSQYRGNFIPDTRLIGKGLVLYYLDGFPCYGLGEGVRIWFGPNNKQDGSLRIVCLYPPKEINFAWRNATRDANQTATTGILTCPVKGERELTIDLSKCTRGADWDEHR